MAKEGTRRWGRVWRRVGIGAGVVIVALILGVVLLGPGIAGRVARGIIERQASASIAGDVRIERVRLSWFGPQVIGPAILRDPDGAELATLNVHATPGLLSLAFGSLDLGEVTLSGTADIVQRADGTTNLQRAISPVQGAPAAGSAAPGSPRAAPRLPRSLAATVRIDALAVTYTREASDAGEALRVSLPDITGDATLAPGQAITAHLHAAAMYAQGDAASMQPAGALSLEATIKNIIAPDGSITLDQAQFEGLVDLTDASMVLADLFSGDAWQLAPAVGERAEATLRFWGTMSDAYANMTASGANASVDVGLRHADGWLTTSRPLMVRALSEGFVVSSPALREALGNEGVFVLDTHPSVTLQVEARLRAGRPTPAGPPDLRGSSITAALRISEFTARAWLAGDQAAPTAYRVEPWELRLESQDIADGLRLRGATSATMDQRPAGQLDIDLTLSGLLDGDGAMRATGPQGLDGTLALTNVLTAPVEGALRPFGLDLTADIGPELNARLTASQRRAAATDTAETIVEAFLESANVRARLEAQIIDGVFRTVGRGVEARVARAGPLLTRILEPHGLRIDSPVTITVSMRNVAMALDAVTNPAGVDLRGLSGNFAMNIAEARGETSLAGEPLTWRIAPTQIRATAPGQGRDITASINTAAHLADQPAGTIELTCTIKPGLDAAGAMPGFKPESIDARLRVTDITTAAIDALGLTRATTTDAIGTDVDLELTAMAYPRQVGTTAGLPRIDGEIAIGAEGATVSGAVRLSQNTLTLAEPLAIALQDVGALLTTVLGETATTAYQPGGQTTITLREFSMPLTPAGGPNLAQAVGNLTVELAGVSAALAQATTTVVVDRASAVVTLAGGEPTLVLDVRATESGRAGVITANLRAPGLLAEAEPQWGRVDLASAKVLGEIAIDTPSAIVNLVMPSAEGAGSPLAALVKETLGDTVNVRARFIDAAQGFDAGVELRAQHASATIAAGITPQAVDLREFTTTATLTAQAFETLLAAFAPTLEPRPRLAQPGPVTIAASPMTIPRTTTGGVDLAQVRDVSATLKAPQRFVVQGLRFAPPDGPARPIGPVGVQGLDASARVPLAAILGQEEGDAKLTLTATMLDEGGPAGQVSVNANVALRGGKPAGRALGEINATELRLRVADRLLTDPGLISGAVGDTATANATFDLHFQPEPSEGASTLTSGRMTARITSPRVQIAQPLTLDITPETASISALRGTWRLSPDWANRWLVTDAARPRPFQLDREAEIQFNLAAATVSRGADVGPLKPGVFKLQFYAKSPSMNIAVPDGVIVTLADLDFTAGHTLQGAGIGLDLKLHDQAHRGPEPIRIQGVAYGVADDNGAFTPSAINLTGSAKAPALSTALIDAILQQNGLLNEALGPRVSLDVQANGVSLNSGRVVAVADSPRAKANLTGDVNRDGVLTIAQSEFTLMEITPKLGSTLMAAIPSIGAVEKRKEDLPHARVIITGLTYPLDGDMRKLNAGIRFEPGPVRFTTSPLFGGILKAVHQRDMGVVGRRLEPLTLTIESGVLAYERYTIPVGEFTFQTQGSINIAERSINVVTFVPFGLLTDEAIGKLRTGLGSLLGQMPVISDLTMVPIRASGSLDNTSVAIDVRAFASELGSKLLRPDQLLERGVRQILERIGG